MRDQYTSSAVQTRPFSTRKKRTYPDSLPCAHCREPFKPTKNRKLFCSRLCFQNSEKAKAGKTQVATQATSGTRLPKETQQPGDGFTDRCRHWIEETEAYLQAGGIEREERRPLVLTGHGISLRIDSGALTVRGGLTHYPQVRKSYRLFPGKHNTPSRIVLLGHSGSISVDAILWLSAQNIPLVFLDRQGRELSTLCCASGSADIDLRMAQMVARQPAHTLLLSKGFILAKIAGCVSNLDFWQTSEAREIAKYKLLRCLESVDSSMSVAEVLLCEASAAAAYFHLWQTLDLEWSAKSSSKVPKDWLAIDQRESRVSGNNRHASHPVSAMLNYVYGVLESQVRISLASEGFDTTISYLHSLKKGRDSLIYDVMEPLRPRLERQVIEFIRTSTLDATDFSTTLQGVCKLNPELSQRVASISLSDAEVGACVRSLRQKLVKAVYPG